MFTLCWSSKGGSGVTTVAATLALARRHPTLLVDLDGDVALALGVSIDGTPTLDDWFDSDAPADRLARLERCVGGDLSIVPTRRRIARDRAPSRWRELARHLAASPTDVVVDAGTGAPPTSMTEHAGRSLLVIRPCYLALVHAERLTTRPSGIVLIDEPGRSLRAPDIEAAVGAPVVATLQFDPKVARAIDSGLGRSRLPAACLRELRVAA